MEKENCDEINSNIKVKPNENSVSRWMLFILLSSIPLINLIFLLFWSISSRKTNPAKAKWALAMLIWLLIIAIIAVILIFFFKSTLMQLLNSGPDFIEKPIY